VPFKRTVVGATVLWAVMVSVTVARVLSVPAIRFCGWVERVWIRGTGFWMTSGRADEVPPSEPPDVVVAGFTTRTESTPARAVRSAGMTNVRLLVPVRTGATGRRCQSDGSDGSDAVAAGFHSTKEAAAASP
jgi:hypothetical protein